MKKILQIMSLKISLKIALLSIALTILGGCQPRNQVGGATREVRKNVKDAEMVHDVIHRIRKF